MPAQDSIQVIRHAGHRSLQSIQRLRNPFAQAAAQFAGRRIGEGDHGDLAHAETALEQQAQVQQGNVVGLAGAGTGFDQVLAGQRQRRRIERPAHGLNSAPASNSG